MARKLAQFFSAKYLKAADLASPRLVTIASIDEQEVGHDRDLRLVIKFVGESQGLVANKTNCTTIADLTGSDDIDEWVGAKIVLFSTPTDFAGRTVDAIRVRAPKGDVPNFATKPVQTAGDDGGLPY